MSFIAEVANSHPGLILSEATREVPTVTVETVYHSAVERDVPYLFYAVQGGDLDAFDEALRADDSVRNPVVIADSGADRLYRVEPTPAELVVPLVADLGGAMLEARCSNGVWTGRFRVPDQETLVRFRERCEERDISFALKRLYRTDETREMGRGDLTDAQAEALVAAYERGYFEEPRETSLEELGDVLGVSSTAVGGRIRRGTAALIESALLSDGRSGE